MTRSKTTWQDLLRPGDAQDFFSRIPFPPFDPSISEYSQTNASWLAELCRLVYRHDVEEDATPPQPTRTTFLHSAQLRQRRFFQSKSGVRSDTQALLVTSGEPPRFAVLVFRGTEQRLKDFISDLEIGLPPLGNEIDVHDGFERALDSVWPEIDRELKTLACPLFYTGHSLGAALATLAAERRAPRAVYTLGSPRVGNQAFVTSLRNVTIHRVVDDLDVVATVPPEGLGFRHAGIEVRLAEPAPIASSGFLGRLLQRLAGLFGPPKFLADHAPINYVDRIATALRAASASARTAGRAF
jgi:hypothetical protein